MITFLRLSGAMALFAFATYASATQSCQSGDFSPGGLLYGSISPDIRYSLHCLIPDFDGHLSIVMLRSDAPTSVTARIGGRVVASTTRRRVPVSREFSIEVRRGQRVDLRVDPIGPGRERRGSYGLLASRIALDDPGLFAVARVVDVDTLAIRYRDPGLAFEPITLAKGETLSMYFPMVGGAKPHLRFTPGGVDPSELIVGVIELSTGAHRIVPYEEGFFHIPATDPEGMVLSIASKSIQTITTTLDVQIDPPT